jgi:hypothetical protein
MHREDPSSRVTIGSNSQLLAKKTRSSRFVTQITQSCFLKQRRFKTTNRQLLTFLTRTNNLNQEQSLHEGGFSV